LTPKLLSREETTMPDGIYRHKTRPLAVWVEGDYYYVITDGLVDFNTKHQIDFGPEMSEYIKEHYVYTPFA
jgi:hypothetical protein